MAIFACENDLNTISENIFLEMPRWQSGHATGCRPVDGSSNRIFERASLSGTDGLIRAGKAPPFGEEGLIREGAAPLSRVNLPRGSKILFMFSGGIDSPVGVKLLKKFYSIIPVHFLVSKFYPKSYMKKFAEFLGIVMEKLDIEKIMIIPFSEVLKKISIFAKRKYSCLLCRKSMLKACELLCFKHGFDAIATGEVLAQKASQTIYNMQATHFGLEKPVLHPLLGMDKDEIVNIAKKSGIILEKHIGACRLVPRYPVTKASPEKVEKMYEEIELEEIIRKAVENPIWIKEAKEFMEVIE